VGKRFGSTRTSSSAWWDGKSYELGSAARRRPRRPTVALRQRAPALRKRGLSVRFMTDAGDEMLPLVTTQGQPLLERSSERLQAAILSRWGQVSPHDAELLAECLVRLAISYATLPAGPAGMTASSIAELLGPYIDRALQAGSDWK
jgi:hypothetical protein